MSSGMIQQATWQLSDSPDILWTVDLLCRDVTSGYQQWGLEQFDGSWQITAREDNQFEHHVFTPENELDITVQHNLEQGRCRLLIADIEQFANMIATPMPLPRMSGAIDLAVTLVPSSIAIPLRIERGVLRNVSVDGIVQHVDAEFHGQMTWWQQRLEGVLKER